MTVMHATFVLERTYDATSARVFAAFADSEAKKRWFAGPEEWGPDSLTLDFRVGGREASAGGPPGGPVYSYNAVYQDIVENERIVYTYDMHMDDTRISVSVATDTEIAPSGSGTRLVLTEQGAFLDGHDQPVYREQGTSELLDALGASLKDETARAETS